MAQDQYEAFRDSFREGMRIEVGIPLAGGGIFRDWAIVQHEEGDELVAQISRDVLPADVRVDEGFILDVTIWVKKEVYTASAIVIEKSAEGKTLRVRLFGDFTLRERRQFFRTFVEVRVRYALIETGSRDDIFNDWERRKELEHMKFQGYDDAVIAGQRARYVPAVELEWRDLATKEVNLGGGGIRIPLPQLLQREQLLALELSIPVSPPRVIHVIAQAIHVMEPKVQRGTNIYHTGTQFLFLDERDRDLIFRHISVTQIEYLRRTADKRDLLAEQQGAAVSPATGDLVRKVVWALLFLGLAGYLVWYLVQYQKQGPPNEIGTTYEKAIRQYRHQE